MTIEQLQDAYDKRMAKKKHKRIGITFAMSPEVKQARALSIVGDCYSHRVRSECLAAKGR